MKKLSLALVILCSQAALAQVPTEVKVDTFGDDRTNHTIHEVEAVTVVKKTEGNMVCLNNEESCEEKYNRDTILINVKGQAEANFGLHDRVFLNRKALSYNYSTGKTITELSLKGVEFSPSSTMVISNMAYAAWGGEAPFNFNIEIHNDMNKETEEREFRIPLVRGEVFVFKVIRADKKWKVEVSEKLSTSFSIKGKLAEDLFHGTRHSGDDTYSSGTLSCFNAKETECLFTDRAQKKLDQALAQEFLTETKKRLEVFGSFASFSLSCESPTKWNNKKEVECSVSSNQR